MPDSDQVSVSSLPAEYQSIFSNFDRFNKVQSAVFDKIFHSDDTLVINSPTGSGKTALLELAIVRELRKLKQNVSPYGSSNSDLHVIYFSPMKAIITEKLKEWSKKFSPFGINCKDFTGDSPLFADYRSESFSSINILLVTPEKFDYSIRTNRPFRQFISIVQLVLIDEIHTLSDKNRGDILEATITRMKMLRKTHDDPKPLRFIGISATAPNVDDIAHWLDDTHGVGINIDSGLRPVKLEKLVLGYDNGRLNDYSEYRFDIMLSYYLENLLRKHANNKPSLVFCSTRKSVEFTANVLASASYSFFNDLDHRTRFEVECTKFARQFMDNSDNKIATADYFTDPKLKETLKSGVAFHHQGLCPMDRRMVEAIYSKSLIPVLVCTSSLAMGVNLPAHLVVIKNTVYYNTGQAEEYESSQVLQMIGRAGRPQFDTEAKAIIMTKNEKKKIYENLLSSNCVIESNLHLTLPVQLTVEIVLNTVNSIDDALRWVESSFLFRRILSNPEHYGSKIKKNDIDSARPVIRNYCSAMIGKLEEMDLVIIKDNDRLEPTKLAKIVIRNSLSISSFEKIIALIQKPCNIGELLLAIADFDELLQDIVLRNSEKNHLNELNKKIKYSMEGKFKNAQMKINCILQSLFSCLTVDQMLNRDSTSLQRTSLRATKCLLEVIEHLCSIDALKSNYKSPTRTMISGKTLVSTVLLLKSIKAKLWFDSAYASRQLKSIGPVMSKKLYDRGYDSLQKLAVANGRDIEFCVGRKPPFGTLLIEEVKSFPKYEVEVKKADFEPELKDISILEGKQWTVKISVYLSNLNQNPHLKSNEHKVSVIIFCESCDEILMHNRITDADLTRVSINKNVHLIRTKIKMDEYLPSIQEDDDSQSQPPPKKRQKASQHSGSGKSQSTLSGRKAEMAALKKSELLSFTRYFDKITLKKPNDLFHCCYENVQYHSFRVKIISESFVGIDQEKDFS